MKAATWEIFSANMFGNMFHGQGGSGFRQQSYRMKGEDLHADVQVGFDDAISGCDKVIHLSSPDGSAEYSPCRYTSLQVLTTARASA